MWIHVSCFIGHLSLSGASHGGVSAFCVGLDREVFIVKAGLRLSQITLGYNWWFINSITTFLSFYFIELCMIRCWMSPHALTVTETSDCNRFWTRNVSVTRYISLYVTVLIVAVNHEARPTIWPKYTTSPHCSINWELNLLFPHISIDVEIGRRILENVHGLVIICHHQSVSN